MASAIHHHEWAIGIQMSSPERRGHILYVKYLFKFVLPIIQLVYLSDMSSKTTNALLIFCLDHLSINIVGFINWYSH